MFLCPFASRPLPDAKFSMALLPFAVPAVLVLVRPSLVPFDVHNQECENETGVLSKLVLGILSVLAVASLALTLRLHSRRMQVRDRQVVPNDIIVERGALGDDVSRALLIRKA